MSSLVVSLVLKAKVRWLFGFWESATFLKIDALSKWVDCLDTHHHASKYYWLRSFSLSSGRERGVVIITVLDTCSTKIPVSRIFQVPWIPSSRRDSYSSSSFSAGVTTNATKNLSKCCYQGGVDWGWWPRDRGVNVYPSDSSGGTKWRYARGCLGKGRLVERLGRERPLGDRLSLRVGGLTPGTGCVGMRRGKKKKK